MLIQLTIDREFRDLCPPSSDDELILLRESIKSDGCRDTILYWENAPDKSNPVIDGHQRHTICVQEKVEYESRGIKLKDRDAAKQWILRNQLCRRNLTNIQRSIARGRYYNLLKSSQGGDHRSKVQNVPLIDAAQVIAEANGVDKKTIKRDAKLATAVDRLAKPVADAVKQGEISKQDAIALAEMPKSEQCEAVKAIQSGEARNVSEATGKPKPEATQADRTKLQVKLWYDTISRWLGQSPSIDEYRAAFPGKRGDRALAAASELYESLKAWHGAIK